MNRTGQSPLNIRVWYDDPRRLAQLLLPHMHRVLRLSLTALESSQPGPLPTSFLSMVQAPAPRLVELSLDSRRLPYQLLRGDLLFKLNAAPQLLSCTLLGIRDGMTLCLTLFNLRELVFHGPVTDRDVMTVLATLEHLERLELHVTAWTGNANSRSPRILPKSLKELCLTISCPVAHVLGIIEHSGIDNISISFTEYSLRTRDTVAACTGYAGTHIINLDFSLQVPVLRRRRFTVRSIDSAGRRRQFFSVLDAKVILQLTTLRYARSIAVDWLEVLLGGTFPALESLTVRVPAPLVCPSEQNLTRNDVTCPALRELNFFGGLPRADPPWWFINWFRESLTLEGKRSVPTMKLRDVAFDPVFHEILYPYAGEVLWLDFPSLTTM